MTYIRRHIVVVFFVLTYLISWGIWFWVNGTHQGLSGWIGLVALLGAFGPSLAGLICAGLASGWSGVRLILKRTISWRVHSTVYLAVFCGPLLIVILPIWLNTFLGRSTPDWQALRGFSSLLPTAFKMLLIGGLTEELGWRGFATPILRKKIGPFAASLMIGLVWGFWHVPIYTLPGLGNPIPTGELTWFIITTPILTIFFTALAERSDDSVLVAILFHAWANTVIPGLPEILGIHESPQLRFLNVLTWLLAAGWIVWIWLRPVRPPAHGIIGSIDNQTAIKS